MAWSAHKPFKSVCPYFHPSHYPSAIILHTYVPLCYRVDGGRLRWGGYRVNGPIDLLLLFTRRLILFTRRVNGPGPYTYDIPPPSNVRKWRPLKRGRMRSQWLGSMAQQKMFIHGHKYWRSYSTFRAMHDVLRILPLSCGHHLLDSCNRTTSDTQLPRTCVSYSTTS